MKMAVNFSDDLVAVGGLRDRDAASPESGVAASLRFRRVPRFMKSSMQWCASWRRFGRRERTQSAAPSVDEPSELDRVAIHEAGHCLLARLQGMQVQFTTNIPDAELGSGGRTVIGTASSSRVMARSLDDGYVDVDRHMLPPCPGKEDATSWFRAVHEAAIEWLAGAAAERIAFGSANDRKSISDYASAKLYARTICKSDVSAEKFLEFALAEAVELITPYRPVLLALASELRPQA